MLLGHETTGQKHFKNVSELWQEEEWGKLWAESEKGAGQSCRYELRLSFPQSGASS